MLSAAAAGSTLLTTRAADARGYGTGPRVLLVGGSQVAGPFGQYLRKALNAGGYVAKREAKSASGLARPDFFNWPKIAADLLDDFQPDAVMVMFGANDAQGQRMPKGHETRWIRWHEPGWLDEYRRRVNAFLDLLSPQDSRQVFWIGMPAMRDKRLDSRVQTINDVYAAEVEARESGFYFESRPVLADDDGGFIDHMRIKGHKVRIRAHDGIHMRGPGATRLVGYVQPLIEAHVLLVPTVGASHGLPPQV